MITAIVKVKSLRQQIEYDAIGFSTGEIQASAEEMYCLDDDEAVCIDVLVLQ